MSTGPPDRTPPPGVYSAEIAGVARPLVLFLGVEVLQGLMFAAALIALAYLGWWWGGLWVLPIGLVLGVYAGIAIQLLLMVAILRLLPDIDPRRVAERRTQWLWSARLGLLKILWRSPAAWAPPPWKDLVLRSICTQAGIRVAVVDHEEIVDPWLTRLGDRVHVGQNAVLLGHLVTGGDRRRLLLGEVVIEADAMIGAGAWILPGCRVGRGGVVRLGAVLMPGTQVGDHEEWGGAPAVKVRDLPRREDAPVEEATSREMDVALRSEALR
jgi:carbonic anhydrase/acetyltransferase-like protein (isoleucine patch superfamily)